MKNKQVLLFSLGFLIATSAHAQDVQNGLRYTARSPALKEQPSGELRSLTYARPDATPVANPQVQETKNIINEPATADAPETPSDKVWEKYKALATGSTAEQETTSSKMPQAPTPPAQPQAAAPQAPSSPVGITGLLQEYKKTKASRSEMRTLVITKPAEAAKIEEQAAQKQQEAEKPAPEETTKK